VSRPVRFSPEAVNEISDAIRWYEERHRGIGAAFVTAVDAAVEFVATWPGTGAPVAGAPQNLDIRRAPVGRFPYHLAYMVTGEVIHVLAVAHDRRRPLYWTGRVDS
jgi:plasmid stabilization system protein ParE